MLETLFIVCNAGVLIGWGLLAAAPGWRPVTAVVSGWILPAVMAVVYVSLVACGLPYADGGFGSLAEVGQLFRNEHMLLAGWVHYLAFDLFVGAWIVRNAQRRGVRHLVVLPCLAMTFLFGPTGFLMYLAVRAMVRPSMNADARPPVWAAAEGR